MYVRCPLNTVFRWLVLMGIRYKEVIQSRVRSEDISRCGENFGLKARKYIYDAGPVKHSS